MRKPLVAGNWKMYKKVAEARHLVSEMVPGLQAIEGVEKVICPPFTALLAVRALLEGTDIGLGAQNLHWETSGAYTGEISPVMISELCQYVIIGHSERRIYFGEVDDTVNRKTQAALFHGLTPIICVGESLDEYESGLTDEVVDRQIRQGLARMDLREKTTLPNQSPLVIAYEPVWAIGTGKSATPEGANAVIANVIRPSMVDLFDEEFSSRTQVLYGGSVKPENAVEFFTQPDIDGALVGGASLNPSDFISIARAAVI